MMIDNSPLSKNENYGKISRKRIIEIFSQIIRHLTALVYLIAELVICEKPDKL